MSVEDLLFDLEAQEATSSYQERLTTATAAAVYEQLSTQVAMLQTLDSSVTAKICTTLFALQRGAPSGSLTAESIASSFATVGIPCRLRRTVVASGEGNCLRQLRHSFVVVQVVGAPEVVYVDPQFKEQFQLARSDPIHNAFLRALPSIFVGTELKLRPLVKLAAEQCLAGLDRLRLARPPWRSVSALMSKWLPEKYTDEKYTDEKFTGENTSWPATQPCGSSLNLQRMSALSECSKQPPSPPVLRGSCGSDVLVVMKVSELKPTKVIHGFSMVRFPPSASQPRVPQPEVPQPHVPQPEVPQPHVPHPHVPQPQVLQPHGPHGPQPHVPQLHLLQPHGPEPHVSQLQVSMQLGDTVGSPIAAAAAVAPLASSSSLGLISLERAFSADTQYNSSSLSGLALLRPYRPAQASADFSSGNNLPVDEAVALMRSERQVEMGKRRRRVFGRSPYPFSLD